MSDVNELSFCELRQKDIVSISDGKKLGKIVDLVFCSDGRIQGIVAPYGKKFLFFRAQEVYIPYSNIKTIGEDIILVDISSGLRQDRHSQISRPAPPPPPPPPEKEGKQSCDGRCDKCMLFDCEDRWRKRNNVYLDSEPYN